MKKAVTRIKFLLSTLPLAMFTLTSFAQKGNLNTFVPAGYTILDTARCDLNQDGLADYLLILKNDEETMHPDTTRPLLILHGKKDGSFELADKNEHVVLCQACGGVFGDPYAGITVKNNFFSIEHFGGSGWRWTRIITFKYDPTSKKYILHRDGGESFHISNPEKKESIVNNKEQWSKLPFGEYNIEK